ncbi:Dipeptidyl aminopeptidase/acylaminoacyl peptidase [Luteibacter sp. UNCMF331Sha3.1]|uniref:alpha/beta hydrolase family protein n=1 Tax=Luteibacter sp. UNCMF331Sha3.1 TaxID=1502760 RepID=UPI0008CC69BA|nr:S9 family peptidase [Luteibacter sp. UNCMF331Sha3.1]SEN07807.1 Dipeptidyl aminopeptidase/acylaminoacyl peptidase [Luteibacter sp. UNCMF331Sha3.1]
MRTKWIAAAIALACAGAAHADTSAKKAEDPRIAAILDSLGKVRTIESVSLSPDAKHLAWTVKTNGKTVLEVADADGRNAHRVTTTKGCSESSALWAPDSRHLAFLSDCAGKAPGVEEGRQNDVHVADIGAKGPPQRLTRLAGYVDGLAWRPDGKALAFLYVPNATRRASATAAAKPQIGEIGVEGIEVQQVAIVDASGGAVRTVTPAGMHVYEFAFANDGGRIAYVAAEPPGDNNWWIARLYVQPTTAGGKPVAVVDTVKLNGPLKDMQIAVPRFSPDGSRIAFIGGLMSDQGSTGGDIWTVPAAGGGAPVDVTPGIHTTPAWIAWAADDRLIVGEHAAGVSRVSRYDLPATGAATATTLSDLPMTIGDGRLSMSLSLDAAATKAAFVGSAFETAYEVQVAGLDGAMAPKAVTAFNAGLKPSWGKAESISWKNEGNDVQGWLLYPANYDPKKRYGMIVAIHGGPAAAVTPRWPGVGYGGAPLSALGYFVFMPNPRGSYGQGEAFVQANRKDFGYGDMRDVLAGVDAIEKTHPVDDKRLGLTGWSYGGFMTMFGVTQTQRFRAAVAGAGISNWQSYYGQNLIDQWMKPFFGASVYDDPAVYAKSSAINFIKQVKTPTLIVVGERDAETPAPQSFEFWHALRAQGVPTSLVVYPGEGHGFARDESRRDVLARALAWFDRYLSAPAR